MGQYETLIYPNVIWRDFFDISHFVFPHLKNSFLTHLFI